MTALDAAIMLRLIFGLGFLWLLLAFLLRQHAIDKFRQQAFSIRDLLFDLAYANPNSDISFGSPAYRALRFELNSLIRFAHHITHLEYRVFSIGCRLFLPKDAARRFSHPSEATITKIHDSVLRHEVEVMIRTLNWNIVKLCAKTSPIFLVIVLGTILREFFRPASRSASTCDPARPTLIDQTEGSPVPIGIKKATAQRMRKTHQAIWAESKELSEAECLVEC